MDSKKIKLKKFKSKSDVNVNSFTNVNFISDYKELPPGEINKVLDVREQFNRERNLCANYSFIFTITPIFSNPLFNPTGKNHKIDIDGNDPEAGIDNGLNIFDNDLFKSKPFSNVQFQYSAVNLDYSQAVDEFLIEKDGWFCFKNPDITATGVTKFFDIEPSRARFDLNSNVKKNWDICITYPYSVDKEHHVVDGGLLIVNIDINVEAGGRKMIGLGTATRHGLSPRDRVEISGMPNQELNGEHKVVRLGLNNGDYKENFFLIDINPDDITSTIPPICDGRLRRISNGYPSEYYLRKFRRIENADYSIYPIGFSNTVFNDKNYQITFNNKIDLGGLRDNLGRPLSEVFLTFIKTNSEGDQFMTATKSGLDLELLSGSLSDINISNIRKIHNGGPNLFDTHTPLEPDINMGAIEFSGDTFYGDLVEYNKTELNEKVLSDVLHRYNTNKRELISPENTELARGPRPEGYMYKPHHRIQIRLFSIFIEEGYLENTGNIPDYSEILEGGKYIWRDYLSLGVTRIDGETLDYPFTNDSHYIHENICFVGKRQDPFNQYGLYYYGEDSFDPPDARGETITDKFITKKRDEIC